jgi:hypothetical protein
VAVEPAAQAAPADTRTGAGSVLVEHFREAMAGVPTPVTVATSMAGGLPHGTTVSAFATLSMAPPMVLVSLDRGSDLRERQAADLPPEAVRHPCRDVGRRMSRPDASPPARERAA